MMIQSTIIIKICKKNKNNKIFHKNQIRIMTFLEIVAGFLICIIKIIIKKIKNKYNIYNQTLLHFAKFSLKF